MSRELVSLEQACLRQILKSPSKSLTAELIEKCKPQVELIQQLIDLLVEGGKYIDFIIPLNAFRTNIQTISFRNSKLSATYFIGIFGELKNLNRINLSGSYLVDDNAIKYLLQQCKMLTFLKVQNCRKLTDKTCDSIVQYGQRLESVHLGGCFNITSDSGINRMLDDSNTAHRLQELNIAGLSATFSTSRLIALRCTGLTTLNIAYALLSEHDIMNMLESIGNSLEVLSIAWISSHNSVDEIKLTFLEFLCSTCPRLKELDISGLKNLTPNAIQNFLDTRKLNQQFMMTDGHEVERSAFYIKCKYSSITKGSKDLLMSTNPDVIFEI